MYERLLVPLDGSQVAETILPFAAQIAGPVDAEVLLLRVMEPMSGASALASGGIVAPDVLVLEQLDAKRYLDEVAKQLTARGLRARTVVRLGSPAAEIADIAKAEKVDLIALTTHGRTGIRRAVFGSVAQTVLRAAAVPVLMFRMPDAAEVPNTAGRPS
jgi:nucleotide-binding universal stress UspA family protein